MDFKHELIQFNDDIPIKLYNGKVVSRDKPENINVIAKHWHSKIEIFYIITGSIDLWVNLDKYELGNDNLIKTYSLLFDILYELVTNFSISRPEKESIKSKKNLDKLTQIVEYIKENRKNKVNFNKNINVSYI